MIKSRMLPSLNLGLTQMPYGSFHSLLFGIHRLSFFLNLMMHDISLKVDSQLRLFKNVSGHLLLSVILVGFVGVSECVVHARTRGATSFGMGLTGSF